MKNLIIAATLLLSFSAAAATPSQGVCSREAKAIATGIAKALGQKTVVSKVVYIESRTVGNGGSGEPGTVEVYNVKIDGKGFTSPETNGVFLIEVIDSGYGCSFLKASLEDAWG